MGADLKNGDVTLRFKKIERNENAEVSVIEKISEVLGSNQTRERRYQKY